MLLDQKRFLLLFVLTTMVMETIVARNLEKRSLVSRFTTNPLFHKFFNHHHHHHQQQHRHHYRSYRRNQYHRHLPKLEITSSIDNNQETNYYPPPSPQIPEEKRIIVEEIDGNNQDIPKEEYIFNLLPQYGQYVQFQPTAFNNHDETFNFLQQSVGNNNNNGESSFVDVNSERDNGFIEFNHVSPASSSLLLGNEETFRLLPDYERFNYFIPTTQNNNNFETDEGVFSSIEQIPPNPEYFGLFQPETATPKFNQIKSDVAAILDSNIEDGVSQFFVGEQPVGSVATVSHDNGVGGIVEESGLEEIPTAFVAFKHLPNYGLTTTGGGNNFNSILAYNNNDDGNQQFQGHSEVAVIDESAIKQEEDELDLPSTLTLNRPQKKRKFLPRRLPVVRRKNKFRLDQNDEIEQVMPFLQHVSTATLPLDERILMDELIDSYGNPIVKRVIRESIKKQ